MATSLSEPETIDVQLPLDGVAPAAQSEMHYLGEFASDVRPALSSVLALAYGLHAGVYGAVSDDQATHLAQLQDTVRAIMRLVDDLARTADTSDAELQSIAPFRAEEILRCVGALGAPLIEGTGLRLIARNFAPGRYQGPASAITRVLFNLVNNAVRNTDRGVVVFGARQTSPDRVEFFVRDTGSCDGSPPHGMRVVMPRTDASTSGRRAKRIAAPAKPTDTAHGLGLAISRRLLASIGSRLEADSRLGEGNSFRFSVHLPEVMD